MGNPSWVLSQVDLADVLSSCSALAILSIDGLRIDEGGMKHGSDEEQDEELSLVALPELQVLNIGESTSAESF
ncbi:hypothetical protein FRC12_020247 [Ceratobasidium sp. 428]|nr:hypothetical protein FRC12_020247 [Ceratobasidium sp. 428]